MSITTTPAAPTLSASTTSARDHRSSHVVGRRASREVLDSSADVFGSSSSPARQGAPSTVVHSPKNQPGSLRSTASQDDASKSQNKQSFRPPPIMLRRPTVSRPAEEDDGFGEGLEGLAELPASPARNEFQRSMQPSPRNNGFLASPRFQPPPSPADQGRRIHARNLSLYFPQPGQPTTSEASGSEPEAPVVDITDNSGRGDMNGFKFGRKPPPESLQIDDDIPGTTKPNRRGHHHKHSLSHNFFSFLDPTATNPGLTGPAPPSPTPWPPFSPSPTSDVPTAVPIPQLSSSTPTTLPSPYDAKKPSLQTMSPGDQLALGFAIAEFFLGASLWVDGQAGGSVSVAGMGYLVVFDALGVAVGVFGRKSQRQGRTSSSTVRRPYGSVRFDTLLYFVQCLFLVFAAVYIAKESVEHVLLDGHSHSHHHASRDTDVDEHDELSYPLMLLLYSTISTAFSGIFLSNHSRLVEAVGPILIPSFLAYAPPPYRERSTFKLSDRVAAFFGNPFSLTVSVLNAGMLIGGLVVSPFHMGTLDTSLSLILAITTLLLSYPPTVAFGHVLLQTAPSPSSDQMRAIRTALEQIEADERVRAIANVRCWRVGAGSGARFSGALRPRSSGSPTAPYTSFVVVDPAAGPAQLVVTIIISLAESASDVDVLAVTKMAWGRLSKAVNDGEGTGEVCVMVRKGHGVVERSHVHDHGSHNHSASEGAHDHGHGHSHGVSGHGCDHDAQSHGAHDKHSD